ncbi:hypothetical protein F5Y10DRAFT_238356 [Nemania abortiva]|nr:hypothetical protein F5Y10DRAFT_238356 [Nemania abortiva]
MHYLVLIIVILPSSLELPHRLANKFLVIKIRSNAVYILLLSSITNFLIRQVYGLFDACLPRMLVCLECLSGSGRVYMPLDRRHLPSLIEI